MSETATSTGAVTSAEPGSDPAASGGAGTPAAPPAGYVSQSEVEKAQEDARRAKQSAEDLRQEIARMKASQTPAAPATKEDGGFDPDAFRQSLLRDVSGTIQLSQAASSLKTEFPHADPTLFAPEKLSQFTSAEALRFAAEDSHRRVAAILEAERASLETSIREELATKFGNPAGPAGSTPGAGGDPTPAQLAAMTPSEIDSLEQSNPGVVERVLKAAGM